MIEEPVERFVFQFPDGWPVIKYDDSIFYLEVIRPRRGVKAVDLLAIETYMFMIEAKDFRGDERRIPNKERIKGEDLAEEIAKKTRDTFEGLYQAHEDENQELKAFSDYLYAGTRGPIKVIALVEEDRPPTPHKSFEQIRTNLRLKVRQKLKNLNVHCNLHDCNDVPDHYGWTVRWDPVGAEKLRSAPGVRTQQTSGKRLSP